MNVEKFSTSPCDTLPLVVKRYDIQGTQTFSSFLHNSIIGTEGFCIEGPYGFSLGLTQESSGIHYVFAAGTGIFPFLDLFDYLLEKILDDSGKGANIFENGFKLHVFASFAQIKDFVGLEICEKLARVCRDQGKQDAFKLVIKAPDARVNDLYEITDSKFNYSFMSKNVDRQCAKVYICGPPVFNEERPADLLALGINKQKIILV